MLVRDLGALGNLLLGEGGCGSRGGSRGRGFLSPFFWELLQCNGRGNVRRLGEEEGALRLEGK